MIRTQPDRPLPGPPCRSCNGAAVVFDTFHGRYFACPACDAVAVAGLFVIRTVSGDGAEEERNMPMRSYPDATRRARRLARLLGVLYPDTQTESVRVIYVPERRGTCAVPCPTCGRAREEAVEMPVVYTARVLPRAGRH